MRAFLFILGIGLLIGTSCKPKTAEADYVLSNEQLANLMLDMQLTDVALGEVNGLERDSLKQVLWVGLEEIYRLPGAELESEIRKLESDPVKLNLVMDKVQVLLDSLR